MKLLDYPETRQTFNFDCGANALASVLVFAGLDEREDRVALLAGTNHDGTSTSGILKVLRYYGLPYRAKQRMRANDLRQAIDRGWPTLVALQAYRESHLPYRQLWDDGHYVVAIGYDKYYIFFEDPSAYHRTWLADEELHQRWHDVDRGGRIRGWGCTVQVAGKFHSGHHIHMD